MDPQNDWDEAEVGAEVPCENLREIGRDLQLLEEFGVSVTDVDFDEWGLLSSCVPMQLTCLTDAGHGQF
jgi:hypothetical protein